MDWTTIGWKAAAAEASALAFYPCVRTQLRLRAAKGWPLAVGIVTSLIVLATTITPALAITDTAAPTAQMSAPTQYTSHDSSPITISGTATDDVGVKLVLLAFTEVDRHTTTVAIARLAIPGARSTAWSFTANLSAGGYSVKAQAQDAAGNRSPYTLPRAFDIAKAAGPAYLTLMFGRTQWSLPDASCTPLPNTVPLDAVAAALRDRGITGTGGVVTDRTAETGLTCNGPSLYPSWEQLAQLRDDYGWSFVSAATHNNDTLLTADQQYRQICGSLEVFSRHGHNRAWGTFAYASAKHTDAEQTGVTARCFAYGRIYAVGRSHDDATSTSPWYQHANSVTGGKCNNPQLPCYTVSVPSSRRYFDRDQLTALMAVGPGEWSTVYMYKFLTGSYRATASTGTRWDCTSADWRNHWTTVPETYCWQDYLTALDAIEPGTIVTDPATVARAWNPDLSPPTSTITSGPPEVGSDTSAQFQFDANEPRVWYRCSLDGAEESICDSAVTYANLAPGAHTFTVRPTDAFGNEGAPTAYAWTVV
jgi:hypothetical protein